MWETILTLEKKKIYHFILGSTFRITQHQAFLCCTSIMWKSGITFLSPGLHIYPVNVSLRIWHDLDTSAFKKVPYFMNKSTCESGCGGPAPWCSHDPASSWSPKAHCNFFHCSWTLANETVPRPEPHGWGCWSSSGCSRSSAAPLPAGDSPGQGEPTSHCAFLWAP